MTRVPGRGRSPDADLSSRFASETQLGDLKTPQGRECVLYRDGQSPQPWG